ncbi:hypothetical protein G6O67_004097 [Ophiocordyceps sinensis]|uniref:Uncharacterized protein n=1 Tax=Ophiocordyceps sinensis TaxID=72228 RepID=A0A8H4LXY1_9HYPO|nr:hypothetical protein G6O67_004097 [Ophiocordyceps sinensis]
MATVAGSPQLRLRRPNHSSSGSCNTGSHRVGNGVVDGQDWGLPSAHDGAADDNEVDAQANLGHDGPRPRQRRLDSSSFRWWTDEYSIVESCICQGAWIWVSKSHQARTRNRARLEDFKLFDEASRGFLGSLALLWRLKGLHLSCLGALIIVVTHGFETFSQQMGVQDGSSLALSTKSAVYSGILAAQVRELEPRCHTANCTWPVFPTLATNATLIEGADVDLFQVNPVNGSLSNATDYNKTFVSMFEIMTISQRATATRTTAAECALWFCLKAYSVSVADGRARQTVVAVWDESRFEAATSAHSDEHVFVSVPQGMNTQQMSRFSVSDRSLKALRSFIDSLTSGRFEHASDVINFSSDWIEAMWQATADLGTWMDKFSLSLTNEIREHGTIRDPYMTNYEGNASKMANYVHVQWFWMMYPALLLVISLYYLVGTIMAGARDDVSAWKGDSLPMLFSRIDARILALSSEKMDVPKGLDDLGKSRVALTKDKDGYWTFEPHGSKEEEDEDEEDALLRMLNYL